MAALGVRTECRLHFQSIKPHDRFRVLVTFGCFAPGSEIELERIATISRDGERAFTFASLHGPAHTELAELNDTDAEILADLDRYLLPT